jgi:glycosyltransferase involved in cell wall biosynthesis
LSRPIADSSFVVALNGRAAVPPASGIVEYLVKHRAQRVTSVLHPLLPDDPARHLVTTYEPGRQPRERAVRLPSRPPYTYPLDLLVPLVSPRADAWFAFTNLSCLRGLAERRLGRAGKVVYWPVDFVAERFGNSPITRAYDVVQRICCTRADARFELTEAALRTRSAHFGLTARDGAPTALVPIGVWANETPKVPEDGVRARRVLYLGHLIERAGVGLLVDALARLRERGVEATMDVAGHGPMEDELRRSAAVAGVADRFHMWGFIGRQEEVRAFLATGSVAVGMYSPTDNPVTEFADPGKLKAYLAAGLPTVINDVPHNARELAAEAGADVVPYDAESLANGIERALASEDEWRARRRAAIEYARRFDWETLLGEPLAALGFSPEGSPAHAWLARER